MEQATISSKYQVVIPSTLRKLFKIKPGQKVFIYYDNGSIRIEQKINIKDYFGIAKGVDPSFERDEVDRV